VTTWTIDDNRLCGVEEALDFGLQLFASGVLDQGHLEAGLAQRHAHGPGVADGVRQRGQAGVGVIADHQGDALAALAEWGEYVRKETLALSLESPYQALAHTDEVSIGAARVRVGLAKATSTD